MKSCLVTYEGKRDSDSKLLSTISTLKGLFVDNWLLFGIARAPAFFRTGWRKYWLKKVKKVLKILESRGIGAVISHRNANNEERPIAFTSYTLTKIHKKIFQYLYGRKFVIGTDFKCLLTVFGSKEGFPVLAAPSISILKLLKILFCCDFYSLVD